MATPRELFELFERCPALREARTMRGARIIRKQRPVLQHAGDTLPPDRLSHAHQRRPVPAIALCTQRASALARSEARDPRWATRRAVGSPAFLARYGPRRRGRPRIGIMPSQNQEVRPSMVSGTFFTGLVSPVWHPPPSGSGRTREVPLDAPAPAVVACPSTSACGGGPLPRGAVPAVASSRWLDLAGRGQFSNFLSGPTSYPVRVRTCVARNARRLHSGRG